MKYVSIDIETTGLDPNTHDILEIAAVLDDLKNPWPIKDLPVFHYHVNKTTPYCVDVKAIKVHGRNILADISYKIENDSPYICYPEEIFTRLSNFLYSHGYEDYKESFCLNVAGKNFSTFDLPFLQKIDKKHWCNISFRSRVIDPAILYFDAKKDDHLPNLETCLQRANIREKVSHNAVDDAIQVIKLIRHKFKIHF